MMFPQWRSFKNFDSVMDDILISILGIFWLEYTRVFLWWFFFFALWFFSLNNSCKDLLILQTYEFVICLIVETKEKCVSMDLRLKRNGARSRCFSVCVRKIALCIIQQDCISAKDFATVIHCSDQTTFVIVVHCLIVRFVIRC